MRHCFFLVLLFSALLAGCGGGSGLSTEPRSLLPAYSEEIEPSGERIDLRAQNYFPASLGDTWTYTREVHGNSILDSETDLSTTATRAVTQAQDNDFSITESTERKSETVRYTRGPAGITALTPLAGIFPDPVSELVGDLLEYPEPFFPEGSVSQSYRQGEWPEDLDGDNRPDSFQIEIERRLVGFHTLVRPNDVLTDVAHFAITTRLRLLPSDGHLPELEATFRELTWWAPGIGLVQAGRQLTVGSFEETEILKISSATVSGDSVYPRAIDGTVLKVALEHVDLVFDPVRSQYYASIPANSDNYPSLIVSIDAQTGALSTPVRTLPGDPGPIAIAHDSSALFVAVNGSGDIVKYQLPDWQELWRVRLPRIETGGRFVQMFAARLAASPTDSDAVVVSMLEPNTSAWHGGVALVKAGVLQQQMTQTNRSNLIEFDPSGTHLYSISDNSLHEISVTPDGLVESRSVGFTEGGRSDLAISSRGIIQYDRLFSTFDLSFIGRANVNAGMCRQLSQTHRWLCLDHNDGTTNPPRLPRTLSVVDPDTFATIYQPVYERGSEITLFSEIVPGPPGQVALRILPDAQHPIEPGLWIYSSPLLQ
ncbi:MAG: hypothetical protein WBD34_05530 [Burkholderiaceae bacterium]